MCSAWRIGVVLVVTLGCGDDDGPMETPDAGFVCVSDNQCNDLVFCNGEELCAPAAAGADDRGCVAGDSPCMDGQMCDEDASECVTDCSAGGDADGDGSDSMDCGGDDCDDSDNTRFPGNTETCDAEGHDEDCDPTTFGGTDVDEDGFVDVACCNTNEGGELLCGTDCDDTRPDVSANAVEACDGRDNDCDGDVDEDVLTTWYEDADGDGFASMDPGAAVQMTCEQPNGYAATRTDCDDAEASANPSAPEVCDGNDNDCDDTVDEDTVPVNWYRDADGDTYGMPSISPIESCEPVAGHVTRAGDCDDADDAINPLAEDICDGVDNDCDGMLEGPDEDVDQDGFASGSCGGDDCDDAVDTVYPGAPEACNRIDDNCSSGGGVDASEDMDDDGHSPESFDCPAGGFPRDDCDDSRADAYLGAAEICNRLDDDCGSGGGNEADEDVDNDGFSPPGAACTGGFPKTDCDDTEMNINPAAPDLCDLARVDENCDGLENETCPSGIWADWERLNSGDVGNLTDCEPGYAVAGFLVEVASSGSPPPVNEITAVCKPFEVRQLATNSYAAGWNTALFDSQARLEGGANAADSLELCPADNFVQSLNVYYATSGSPRPVVGLRLQCGRLRIVDNGGTWELEPDPTGTSQVSIGTVTTNVFAQCDGAGELAVGVHGDEQTFVRALEMHCATPRLRLGNDGGCADTTREGYLDEASHPDIAACGGGWEMPGIRSVSPACSRNSGDDIETAPPLNNCTAQDLCAEGWHICESSADVMTSEPGGCSGIDALMFDDPSNQFFATGQGGNGSACTASGTNDIFGCALGSAGDSAPASCDPLDVGSGNQCSAIASSFDCPTASDEIGTIIHSSTNGGGVLCCRDLP